MKWFRKKNKKKETKEGPVCHVYWAVVSTDDDTKNYFIADSMLGNLSIFMDRRRAEVAKNVYSIFYDGKFRVLKVLVQEIDE